MDDEERRILEQYRGSPEYYRRLQEYKLAKGRALPFAQAKALLAGATAVAPVPPPESPPVTDYYRQLYDEQIRLRIALPFEQAKRLGTVARRISSQSQPGTGSVPPPPIKEEGI